MEVNKDTLPKGWTIANLGELCEVVMGQSPPSETYNTSGIGLPFFQGKKEFTKLHPIVEKWCSVPNKIAEINDILISVRAPVGDTNIANQKCCIGRGLAAIRYSYDNKYILYYLKLIKEQLNEKGTGTTFKAISGDLLKQTTIPLAPLPEQTRILAKLEQLLTDLDKGIEYLETTKQQLKVYRQAVLKWAFEGKLTNKDVKDGELPKGWTRLSLGSHLENIEAGKSFKCEERPPLINEVGVLKVSAVTWGKYLENESKTVTNKSLINEKFIVKNEDFLISRANTLDLVGAVVIVKGVSKRILLSDKTLRLNFKNNTSKEYILYYLRSSFGRKQIQSFSSGNQESMRNIGQDGIKKISIPFPQNFNEQQNIVSEIESRLSVCDKIEETIEKSLQQADALRLSIIKKAFEGKLLSDAEINECRNDPAWEPAEKLLERIKAFRETQSQPKKGKAAKKEKRKTSKKKVHINVL
jgi:type I restriction enzyme S subunit